MNVHKNYSKNSKKKFICVIVFLIVVISLIIYSIYCSSRTPRINSKSAKNNLKNKIKTSNDLFDDLREVKLYESEIEEFWHFFQTTFQSDLYLFNKQLAEVYQEKIVWKFGDWNSKQFSAEWKKIKSLPQSEDKSSLLQSLHYRIFSPRSDDFLTVSISSEFVGELESIRDLLATAIGNLKPPSSFVDEVNIENFKKLKIVQDNSLGDDLFVSSKKKALFRSILSRLILEELLKWDTFPYPNQNPLLISVNESLQKLVNKLFAANNNCAKIIAVKLIKIVNDIFIKNVFLVNSESVKYESERLSDLLEKFYHITDEIKELRKKWLAELVSKLWQTFYFRSKIVSDGRENQVRWEFLDGLAFEQYDGLFMDKVPELLDGREDISFSGSSFFCWWPLIRKYGQEKVYLKARLTLIQKK